MAASSLNSSLWGIRLNHLMNYSEPRVERKFYFHEQKRSYQKNFIEKFCKNEEYREKCLERTADWAIVSDTFDPLEGYLCEKFSDKSESELKKILKQVFAEVRHRVRQEGQKGITLEEVKDDLPTILVSENI